MPAASNPLLQSTVDALGDAVATAQLFLVLLAEAERQGINSVGELRRLARSGRWVAAG